MRRWRTCAGPIHPRPAARVCHRMWQAAWQVRRDAPTGRLYHVVSGSPHFLGMQPRLSMVGQKAHFAHLPLTDRIVAEGDGKHQ